MFSIDGLIDVYYPALNKSNGFARKHTIAFLRTLFHESEIQQFERKYSHLDGFDLIDEVLRYFEFTYTIRGRDLERIPCQGRLVIVDTETAKVSKRRRYMGIDAKPVDQRVFVNI